jgi:uncharacterized delta-60 repeat protein
MKARFVLPLVSTLMFYVADLSAAGKPGGGNACQNPVPVNPVWDSCTTGSQLSGCLDSTFNGTGLATTAFGGNAEPVAVRQDVNGNSYVIGQVNYSDGSAALAITRYLVNGTLDTGFASGGILIDRISGTTSIFGTYDGSMDAAGDLLVVISLSNGYSVRRYSPAGVPDATFNNNALSAFSALTINRPDALRVQSDGKIVISGDYISSKKSVGFAFRLNPDGTADASFGSKGLVLVSSLALARGAALQSAGLDQYFLLGGTASNGFALIRLTPSGSIDTTFGSGGITITSHCQSAAIFGLATDADGNILAGGATQLATNGASKILIARYTANGTLDDTFGDPSSSSGTRTGTTVLDTFGGTNNVSEIVPTLDSAGHILLAGNGFGSSGKFLVVARYNSNGTLDSTFGSGGVAATNFGNDNNYVMQLPASNLTIQSNGELVLTGGTTLASGGSYVFGIARYWP